MTPEFHGTVIDGKLKLADRPLFEQYLHTLKGIVIITVEKYRRKRTNSQNAWYWKCIVGEIAREIGEPPQATHEALKAKFSEMRDVHGVLIPLRSSAMDTTAFSEYCERVRQWAAEFLHLNIPDPPDKNQPLDSSNQPLSTNEHTMSEEEIQAPAEDAGTETAAPVEAPADVPVAEEAPTEPQAEAASEQA